MKRMKDDSRELTNPEIGGMCTNILNIDLPVYGSDLGVNFITSRITAVSGGYVSGVTASLFNNYVDAIIPHFDANCNFVGLIKVTEAAVAGVNGLGYTIVGLDNGAHPVVNGVLWSPILDLTMVRIWLPINVLQPVEGVFNWVQIENDSQLKIVREMNRIIGEGIITAKKKQIILAPVFDYPYKNAAIGICQGATENTLLMDFSTGTARAGTATSIQLATTEPANDDDLNNYVIRITGGTGSGQSKTITDYTGSTRTATVSTWTTTPDETSTYSLSVASTTNDTYNGFEVFVASGTGKGQRRIVSDYVGSTRTATISEAWDIVPDETSGFLVTPTMIFPEWLTEKLIVDGEYDGSLYGLEANYGWVPNYRNPVLIAEHKKMLDALGDKYADDPMFLKIMVTTIGRYGEFFHFTSMPSTYFPTNAIFNDNYLQDFVRNFDTRFTCRTNLGNAGLLGSQFNCHGIMYDGAVYPGNVGGSLDALNYGTTDHGEAQTAVTNLHLRYMEGEPWGSDNGAAKEVGFYAEPTNLFAAATWELKSFSGASNSPIDTIITRSASTKYYSTIISVTGGTSLFLGIRPGVNTIGRGYYTRVRQLRLDGSDHKLVTAGYASVNNRGTINVNASTTLLGVEITIDRNTTPDITPQDLIDAYPRLYIIATAGNARYRNYTLIKKHALDYHMSSYNQNMTEWLNDSSALEANCRHFYKKYIGYRLGVETRQPRKIFINNDLLVKCTFKNTGIAATWLLGYKVEVSLLNGSNEVVYSATADLPQLTIGETVVNVTVPNIATYGVYNVAVAILNKEDEPSVDFYGGTSLSGRYITFNGLNVRQQLTTRRGA